MNQTGLTTKQVQAKISAGKQNLPPRKNQTTVGKIILKNTLTVFNLVNLILALMIISVGAYKNLLFVLIAIANTLISIVNEIRAKKTVDKMRLVSEQKPTVIRNGKSIQINQTEIVEGDLIIYALGDQILVDSKITEGSVEVNEAFITGEQDNIEKKKGDKLISGSFVVSGTCKAEAVAVGADSELSKIESTAHTIKTADSKLFTLMNKIVKYISIALIPIGALMLWSRFRVGDGDTTTAVTSTVASLINMIPEGLVLLTSSVLALATIRLSKKQVLVQDLYSVETLARVDTIALDKTGTLTTGKMTVHDYTTLNKSFETAIASILSHQTTENATISALKQKFARGAKIQEIEGITEIIDFSSERKHSGIVTDTATYLLGAVEFVTDDENIIKKVESASAGYRTLAVVKRKEYPRSRSMFADVANAERPSPVTTGARERSENDGYSCADILLGFIRLEDEIRPDAKQIIKYFYDNDIDVKIISGDDLEAVTKIASRVGVRGLKGVNLSDFKSPDYAKLVKEYSIFTRVKPAEKKQLIKAMKDQDRTVAMTGDGVNDILAMKESDVSIAIGEGSDAARRSAKLVLLNSGFESVPSIIDEGRQSINNLERSTALFLAKTVYASILAVIFILLPIKYPFSSPVEMSLLNFACIGFPGLVLALEHNTERIKNRFTRNIIEYSLPVGLTISISMLTLSLLAHFGVFPHYDLATTAVFVTFTIDLILIYWISRPLNTLRAGLLLTIIAIFAAAFLIPFAHDFFDFVFLTPNGLIATLIAIASSIALFEILRRIMKKISSRIFDQSNI
ncbi:cation-translocating P-type ATPase [Candidatus Saccharibacteria bacterium]|nr:cation-translocating P-type ATPase [Candidatus Saccharibacteria bacterium]